MSHRIEWLLVTLAASVIFAFHANLKKAADPVVVQRISEAIQRPTEWLTKVAPDFELPLRDGTTFHLADHVGKEIVILNFFATWCGPCRAEAPELNRFATNLHGKPVIILGIDAGEAPAAVDRYIRELGVPYAVGIDESDAQQRYGVRSFPTTVVIGANGRIALYETTAILNTEVSFGRIVDRQVAELRSGKGTTREAYLQAMQGENYRLVTDAVDSDHPIPLSGRAAPLAEQMDCLCGCSDRLTHCNCSRAQKMKKRLVELAADTTKSDAEIITAVNAELCIRGKKEM